MCCIFTPIGGGNKVKRVNSEEIPSIPQFPVSMSTFPARICDAKEAADAADAADAAEVGVAAEAVKAVKAETRERGDGRSCFMSREKVAEAARAATDRPSRFSRVQVLSALEVHLYNAFVAR